MARKGSQQKMGLDRHSSHHKKGVSDLPKEKGRGIASEAKVVAGEELPNYNQPDVHLRETESRSKQKKQKLKSDKSLRTVQQEIDAADGPEYPPASGSNSRDDIGHTCTTEASDAREENGSLPNGNNRREYSKTNLDCLPNRLHAEDVRENLAFSEAVVRQVKASAAVFMKAAAEWAELQKPWFIELYTRILNARDYARGKIHHAYPIVLKWLMHVGNIVLLLSMVWLDCALRGIDSFLRMGTTSFFSLMWFSILSIIAMIGMSKFLVVLVLAALIGIFIGFAMGILLIAISGIVFLWLYGSFWTTSLIITIGGLAFMFSRERLALFITTVYSIYCAWTYVGWLGLLLGMNLSFISSDALIFFLKNSMNEQRNPNNPTGTAGGQGRPGFFYSGPVHTSASETGPSQSTDRSSGVPSTSGSDSEITSEDEVVRLLNCADHYEALGFSRYGDVDVSVLKREYRKKAMLVHPDKNMGNEKAADAFKKLQNAYEVLLDSLKRKTYDEELRREELLNYFRRFQSASQKNAGHGLFASGFTRTDSNGEDPLLEARRIACRKCGNFHVWIHTKKSKSQARWCQDCNDFHQAKDGDGWVELSSQPFLFGILQKVDPPSAYVCADSKIYDATEWYICQGMRCPVNTHKPSFHVNTNVTSKNNSGKGTTGSGQKGSGVPGPGLDENMTEEEFFEWLQNAVQAGAFDNFSAGTSSESPSGNASKSGGSNTGTGGGCSSKRKKKGKKPR